jgi:RHS repeat-associated protein
VDVSARRYRYVGLERDDETGLYAMGARYYAAWLGRWTSADPLGIGADGPGVYNYVRGSPIVLTDPGGMESETSAGGPTRKFLEAKVANRKEAPAAPKKFEVLVDPNAGDLGSLLSGLREEGAAREADIALDQAAAHRAKSHETSTINRHTEAFLRGTGLTSLPRTQADLKQAAEGYDFWGIKGFETIGRAAAAMAENAEKRLRGDTEAWAENAGAGVGLAVTERVGAAAWRGVARGAELARPYARILGEGAKEGALLPLRLSMGIPAGKSPFSIAVAGSDNQTIMVRLGPAGTRTTPLPDDFEVPMPRVKPDASPTPRRTASGKSAAEAAKDVPIWAKGERPLSTETGNDFARRLMDNKYGPGKWKGTGPTSEFSKIRKWGDRGFE